MYATTPPNAGRWEAGLADPLRGARVRLLWDRDDAGRVRAWYAIDALRAVKARVRCMRAAQGKDITDHLAAGLGLKALVREVPERVQGARRKAAAKAAGYDSGETVAQLVAGAGGAGTMVERVLTLMVNNPQLNGQVLLWPRDLKARPPRKWLIQDILPQQAVVVVYAEPGVGKTTLGDDWADAIARSGAGWNGYPTAQGTCLTLTGEDVDQHTVRLQALDQLRGPQDEGHAYLEHEWDITTLAGMAKLVQYIWEAEQHTERPVVLVHVDPVGLYGTRNRDGVEDTEPMAKALKALAQGLGICVVAWQHANASGQRARGTEHLRMYCDVYCRMETIGNDVTWAHDQKNKRGALRAMRFTREQLTDELYYLDLKRGGPGDKYTPVDAAREHAESRDSARAEGRTRRQAAAANDPDVWQGILDVLPSSGGVSTRAVAELVGGERKMVSDALKALQSAGRVQFDVGARGGHMWWKV
jgi:hypothetical protein